MHLPKFTYVSVSSLEEAVPLLANSAGDACLTAGGTELLPRLKYGLARPQTLVSLKGVAATAPTLGADGSLRLDALSTLSEVAGSELVQKEAPILAAAARAVGSNEIRNMATLGGNLCQDSRCLYFNQSHEFQFVTPCYKRGGDCCYFTPGGKRCWAVFMSDTAPALICLKAAVEILGPVGPRRIALEQLYRNDPLAPLALAAGEIISRIMIPARSGQPPQAFAKFSWRRGFEFSALSVAAVLETAEDRWTCSGAQIAIGAVAPAPLRAAKAETALVGRKPNEKVIAAAADAAAAEIRPIPHHGYSRAYLTECIRVQVRRVLHTAVTALDAT